MADDVAYSRFGYSGTTEKTSPKIGWTPIKKALGLSWNDNCQPSSSSIRAALEVFFGHLKLVKQYTEMPPELYDLLDDNGDVHQRKVLVRRETLGMQEYCFLSNPGQEGKYELALTSAVAVVQVFRNQWGPDLSDIARELLARGIGFHTFLRGDTSMPRPQQLVPRFTGLGYRPPGYKPDKHDYVAYVERRNRLLASPRGRAALLHGGLISRLAREVVPFQDVIDGPSDNVTQDGQVLAHARDSRVGYWEDYLTEDEIDIICGVYQVDTGERSSFCCNRS
jgi:hypothetical protein